MLEQLLVLSQIPQQCSLKELTRGINPDANVRVVNDPMEAIREAIASAGPNDLVWVTGSLYLVGDIREHWAPSDQLIEKAEHGLAGNLKL